MTDQKENTVTLSSPSITPPWTTRPHWLDSPSNSSRVSPANRTYLSDLKEEPQAPRISRELSRSPTPIPKPLSADFCLDATWKSRKVPTPNRIRIVKRTDYGLTSVGPPSMSPTRRMSNNVNTKPLGTLQFQEKSMKSIQACLCDTIARGASLGGITREDRDRFRQFAVFGFTAPQDQVNLILFLKNFQELSLRMLPSGGVDIKARKPSGLMMLTPHRRRGLPVSLKSGQIGIPSSPNPRDLPYSLDLLGSLSRPTIPLSKWDSHSQTSSQLSVDLLNT